MIPTVPTNQTQLQNADTCPLRFFLDDAFDAGTDGDWWLDLGRVDLPTAPTV
jgi:hypothetical protein